MVPGSTTYRPDGQASRCLPFVSVVSGAVFGRSTPFTEIPRADTSTTSPDLATMGFNRGAAPSPAGSGITIAAHDGERCERFHRTELDQIRASIRRGDVQTHWERWRGIDAKAKRAAELERGDGDTGGNQGRAANLAESIRQANRHDRLLLSEDPGWQAPRALWPLLLLRWLHAAQRSSGSFGQRLHGRFAARRPPSA